MSKILIGGLICAVLLIPVATCINCNNTTISYEEQIESATSFIDTSTQRRHDGIMQLVQVVERFAKHETSITDKVTDARKKASDGHVDEALAAINVIKEAYPTHATESQFAHLSNEISSMENQIKRARDNRNEFIREYNRYVKIFPNRFFLIVMGYEKKNYKYFEAKEEHKGPMTSMFSKQNLSFILLNLLVVESMNRIEITAKEILFCSILGILGIAFFMVIDSYLIAKDQDEISKMNQALIFNTIDEFNHGVRTDVGWAFCPFEIEGKDRKISKKFPEIVGDFMAVKKVREEYRMHTYTTTDSKGRTTTHTYWSWDYISQEIDYPALLNLNGIEVDSSFVEGFTWVKLEVSPETIKEMDNIKIRGSYVKNGRDSDTRWYYEILPVKITGSFFGFLTREFPIDVIEIHENVDTAYLSVKLVEDIKNRDMYRWLTGGAIFIVLAGIFCWRENEWLNGRRRRW